MSGGSLSIRSDDLTPVGIRILVNSTDISDMITELDITFRRDEVITATITIAPKHVEIDSKALVRLQALVKEHDE